MNNYAMENYVSASLDDTLSSSSTYGGPTWHKVVGITLALSSSLFIGLSFVLKKKGLINSNSLPTISHHHQSSTTTTSSSPHPTVIIPSSNTSSLYKEANSIVIADKDTASLRENNSKISTNHEDRASQITSTSTITSNVLADSHSAPIKKQRTLDAHPYLKQPLWWIGLIAMILGEIFNFAAYAFMPAIVVTPLGALSVVISTIFSSIFLKETLSFSGKIGCALCILGSTVVVMYAPSSNTTKTIPEFFSYVLKPGFLVYSSIMLLFVLALIFYLAPRYAHRSPVTYIAICSIVGSYVVISIEGLGASIIHTLSIPSDNQFLYWYTYPLILFVLGSGVVQILYLNMALNIFSTAIVTPIYYVTFTTFTLITSSILIGVEWFSNPMRFITLCIGFMTIVGGVALLFQLSIKMTSQTQQTNSATTLSPSKLGEGSRRLDEDIVVDGTHLGDKRSVGTSTIEDLVFPHSALCRLKSRTEPIFISTTSSVFSVFTVPVADTCAP